MNTYECFRKGKSITVTAETSYSAQCIAFERWGRKGKRYDITVVLVEKDGEPVIHKPDH